MRALREARRAATRVRRLRLAAGLLALAGLGCLGRAAWIGLKAQLAQVLIARAWTQHERGAGAPRPWPWADTTPVARLTAPDGHRYYVLEGGSGRNLAFGPVHDAASVLPGGAGNSVISGHRDTSFAFLARLRRGDALRVERDGRAYRFVVDDLQVVDSRHTRIELAAEAARLTLVTCYPFDSVRYGGPLRYVVTADLDAAG